MPELSEANNHASKIDVFPVSHTIISTIGLENGFVCPALDNKIYFMTR